MCREVHLLVMIHGMWGTPDNLSEAKRVISEKSGISGGTRLEILVAQTNQDTATYDGIDWGSERVADEVYERVAELEEDKTSKVTLFSVFGYSLGGLLGRYLLGILHSRNFFNHVKPANFTTFVTPHIGLPRYRSMMSAFAASLGSKFLSRSGEQLYGVDKWGKQGRPLLEVLADKNRIFWRALALFPHIHVYANAVSDPTVHFVTAAIELEDPFLAVHSDEMEIKLDPYYGALVESYKHVKSSTASRFSIRSLIPSRASLPLWLRRGVLIETTMLILTPVLLPTFFSVVVFRLARDYHASCSRIKLLETDENSHTKLVNMLDSLETAVETIMDPASKQEDAKGLPQDPVSEVSHPFPSIEHVQAQKHQDAQPVLTEAQKIMVGNLNDISQLKKHCAFFHPVGNAHGLIVCRDVKAAQRAGGEWEVLMREAEGVLRHWADGFRV